MMTSPTTPALPCLASYQYKPIQAPDEIRILQLLPGDSDEEIQITLIHCSLESLSECEALSYVWGAGNRDQNIYCEEGIIKATPNLLEALKRLRNPASTQPRLLWIDAICINQDDLAERSQQVPLMTHVYSGAARVLVWIGEERPTSRKAFELLDVMDETARSLGVVDGPFFKVDNEVLFRDGLTTQQLIAHEAWPDVLDILASRPYFTRLWTIQEIALSNEDKTQVLCGSLSCPWLVFYNATRMLENCSPLRQTIATEKLEFMNSIEHLRALQKALHLDALSLFNCMGRTEQQQRQVRYAHDRLFGVLGLLQAPTRSALSNLDYATSPDEVFQVATIVMILESQALYHFIWRDVVSERSIPSWQGFSDFEPQYRFPMQFAVNQFPLTQQIIFALEDSYLTKYEVNHGLAISIPKPNGDLPLESGWPVLLAQGFVLDEITSSFENFSEQNFQHQIKAAYLKIRETSTLGPEEILDIMWLPLCLYNPDADTQEIFDNRRLSFLILFSRWVLEDLEQPDHNYKQDELEFFVHHASQGVGALGKAVLGMFMLYRENLQVVGQYGRNLFFSSKQYIGVGPMGRNELGNGGPAVKVGDKLVVLAGLRLPVVLRPGEYGQYKFVGPAHIPQLLNDPRFAQGFAPEMETIRIR